MKKSFFMVIALLALSSLMAAMAFSSAQVSNSAALSVVNTDSALLALNVPEKSLDRHAGGNSDGTARIVDGNLVFDFNKGASNRSFGLQKNSEYVWLSLFETKNNTSQTIRTAISTENVPEGVSIFMRAYSPDKTGGEWKEITRGSIVVLNNQSTKWDTKYYDVKIVVDNNADLKAASGMKINVHSDLRDNRQF